MRIRWKTLLVILLITIILMSIIYMFTQKIMLDSVATTENKDAERNAERFITNMKIKLQAINSTDSDWAAWDDTYQFIQDNNTAYIQSNLPDQTLIQLGLNLILYINQSRQLVFGKEIDLTNQTDINLQDAEISQISNNNFLYANSTEQSEGGLILFEGTPMLVISHPILTSDGGGPVRGALIMGRFLDRTELDEIALAVGLPLETCATNTSQMPLDFQLADKSLTSQEPIFTHVTNQTNIAGYVLLQDVSGTPILIVKVDSYRSAFLQATDSLNYIISAFVILGFVIFIVTAILLDRIVLLRVSQLTRDVTKIDPNSNQQNHVNVKGNDELSNLGNKINRMLTEIHDSHNELRHYSEILEKKVEERTSELKAKQEELRSIFAASPETILAIDLQNKITESNRQFYEFSGYSRNELIGKPAFSFLSEGDYKEIREKLEIRKNVSISRIECNIIRKNMSVFPAELTIGPMQDSQGVPFGFVVMIRDLTEKKEMERKLFQSERLAAIGEMAGMVGHDLRNPLAGIKNAVYFLKKKGASVNEEQAKILFESIDKGIDHSDKIIKDLLDYARNMNLELETNSVQNLLKNALALVKTPENVKIMNNVSEDPIIRVDKNKIERVFTNLVKNAIEAMPNGGIIAISCKQAKDSVEITFADTGTGIPQEILPKIFTPLFTTKAQGMGFGLAICKRIIEAHAGTITIETEKGKGTTFKITLPIEAKQTTENRAVWITSSEYLVSTTKT